MVQARPGITTRWSPMPSPQIKQIYTSSNVTPLSSEPRYLKLVLYLDQHFIGAVINVAGMDVLRGYPYVYFCENGLYIIWVLFLLDGEYQMEEAAINTDFTFDLFLCVAVLEEYREKLLECDEVSKVYNLINKWARIDLQVSQICYSFLVIWLLHDLHRHPEWHIKCFRFFKFSNRQQPDLTCISASLRLHLPSIIIFKCNLIKRFFVFMLTEKFFKLLVMYHPS